jgi:hypothetical protein
MRPFYLAVIFFSLATALAATAAYQPGPDEIARPQGLPPIGKWLITPELRPANWLGQQYRGKEMREPINIIIIDRSAKSNDEAKRRLVANCAAAGFPSRWGHSAGYHGYLDGKLLCQLPEGEKMAFSDRPCELSNNHGRIFGPYFKEGKYYFIGAFSREVVNYLKIKEIHQFGSFLQARAAFARGLDQQTEFKLSGYIDLGNAIGTDPKLTTGDHDGKAALLKN